MSGHLAALLATAPLLLVSGIGWQSQPPRFGTRTLSVRVDALVTEGRRPVVGLTAADFELRDNGILQTVQVLDAADVALNVVLALDTSASTEGKRHADLVSASQALLNSLNPSDRAALVTFNQAVIPATLTSNLSALRRQLGEIKPSGRTAVMDGVYVALATTLAQAGRSLVVVYTDGSDVSSWLEPRDVVESAKRANAVVYAVTTADSPRTTSLKDVTNATGGAAVRVTATSGLRDGFQKILQEFRSRYILAFTPAGVAPGGLHRLDVRVKRRGVTVNARTSYLGEDSAR